MLADPTLVGLIALSALASALAFAAVAVPVWLWGHVNISGSTTDLAPMLLYAVAAWASAFVGVLGQATVVAAGMARLDGRPITTRQAVAMAWSRRRPLAAWAVATTLVAVLERMLSRFGVAGAITRLVTDIGWSLATMLVVPIVIVEGTMPTLAIRTSAALVKDRLGLTVRTIVRFAVPWVVATLICFLVTAGGVAAFLSYRHDVPTWAAGGLILAVLGVVGLFGSLAVQSAAGAYLNMLLYRHASGLPTPGVDPIDLPRLAGTWPAPPPIGGTAG